MEAYVSHGSTGGTSSISTLLELHSQGTTRKSQLGVFSKQSRDLSKGQEVTANVERPVVGGHLHGNVELDNERRGKKQQTFHLVYFIQDSVKGDYSPKSARMTLVARGTHTQILSSIIR